MYRLLKNVLTLSLLVFIAINISASSSPQEYNLLIKNGKVISGTGNPWFYADIGIQGGKITAIGDLSTADAVKTINAENLIVCPGFIPEVSNTPALYREGSSLAVAILFARPI